MRRVPITMVTAMYWVYILPSQCLTLFFIILGERFFSSGGDSSFIFAKKSKGTRKTKVRKSANKLPLSIMVHIFNSVPYFNPCLLSHQKCYQGSALLFLQLIILLCFKENWKLTSELNWKNIKHLLCNVITNYLLSILYLAPANLSF